VAEGTGQGAKNLFALRTKPEAKNFSSLTLDLFPMRSIHTPCQKGKNNSLWGTLPSGRQKENSKQKSKEQVK
jgi:hypothetical protein